MSRTPDSDNVTELSVEDKRALLARLLRECAGRSRTAELCTHQLFETQARQTPLSIAVSAGEERLTYRELDARSNQLAHYLRRLGVGPDVMVGLCIERTVEMMVAVLGILKAGGAYVPLDPTYPRERLGFMVADAAMPVLITQEHLRGVLPEVNTRVVELERDRAAIGRESEASLPNFAHPESLSYVIYTSGSTGKPKGVLIPHAALVNLLESLRQMVGFKEHDSLLSISSLSFDIATLDIFLPLIQGGRLHLISREDSLSAERWVAEIEREKITFLQATPTAWRMLVETGWRGSPTLTKLSGGEPLPRELADILLGWGGPLWNLYGPTETTIYSTGGKVEHGEGPLSIGRPLLNTRIYVLDHRLRPVPVGIIGEVYLGGVGLARGYLDRPSLTADRFLPDPFSKTPGERLYRSGDLARYRHDGSLECVGRVDHQVKIRGFRIELGEIESALRKHPTVRDAVVMAREDTPGDKRLVAYIVANPVPTAAELWDCLREKLPEHMVPAVFLPLDALPITPNGKVDRNALPAPEQARRAPEAGYVAPRDPIEEALAVIWAGALGKERVGIHDNFFILGGHSLMATQLLTRVRETFGTELPLRVLFEAPTIAGLARRLEEIMPASPRPQGQTEASLAGIDR